MERMLEKAIEIEGLLRIIRDGNPLPETYNLLKTKTLELAMQAESLCPDAPQESDETHEYAPAIEFAPASETETVENLEEGSAEEEETGSMTAEAYENIEAETDGQPSAEPGDESLQEEELQSEPESEDEEEPQQESEEEEEPQEELESEPQDESESEEVPELEPLAEPESEEEEEETQEEPEPEPEEESLPEPDEESDIFSFEDEIILNFDGDIVEEEAHQPEPVSDIKRPEPAKKKESRLRSAFSLNDRFLYSRELFEGNMKMFDSTLDFLEGIEDYSIIEDYFYSELEWDPENRYVASFMDILRPHFKE